MNKAHFLCILEIHLTLRRDPDHTLTFGHRWGPALENRKAVASPKRCNVLPPAEAGSAPDAVIPTQRAQKKP